MTYSLTIQDKSRRFSLLREECCGDTPRVGDLVTIHPDGDPSDDSLTARVTGVQRVLKPTVQPPGAPRSDTLKTTHVAVTAVHE